HNHSARLYAGGMAIRDIQHHLASTIGTDRPNETISYTRMLSAWTPWQGIQAAGGFLPSTSTRPELARVLCRYFVGRLSGEGLVVERLELYWGDHPHRAVEAPVVVPVDPAGGRELDVRERPERPAVEDGGADALGLDSPTAEPRAVPPAR